MNAHAHVMVMRLWFNNLFLNAMSINVFIRYQTFSGRIVNQHIKAAQPSVYNYVRESITTDFVRGSR